MHQIEYVVSACLAGVCCRYDGKSNAFTPVMELVRQGRAILVCPEQLGGMATPRVASEIQTQAPRTQDQPIPILQKNGNNVTKAFTLGAHEALYIAQLAGCSKAILKARSPSCGCGIIYDGSFSKKLVTGNGIFAQAAIDAGLTVWTEETWCEQDN